MFTPFKDADPNDIAEYQAFMAAFGCYLGQPCYNPDFDYNEDGFIYKDDLLYLSENWNLYPVEAGNWYYLHDALGSVCGLIEADELRGREFYGYDVYGFSLYGGSSRNPYLFAGYRFDEEIEFYHTHYRTYDPAIGRWLQFDPIGYADGMNLYEYVSGSPVMYVDPWGLEQRDDFPQEPIQQLWPSGPVEQPMQNVRNPKAPVGYSSKGQGPIYVDKLNEAARNKFHHQNSGRFASKENFKKQATPNTRAVPGQSLATKMLTDYTATQIATYGYTKYISELERMGREKVESIGLCTLLKRYEGIENCSCKSVARPTAFRFNWRGTTYAVIVQKDSNACFFTAWHLEKKFFWTLMESHNIVKEDLKLGDCPADCRSPGDGCK